MHSAMPDGGLYVDPGAVMSWPWRHSPGTRTSGVTSGRWYIVKISSKLRTRETPKIEAPPPERPRRSGDTGEWFAGERPFDQTPTPRARKKS